jgi:hypothetical protein
MNSEPKSMFSYLPDEITQSIYEMHNIHYIIHQYNIHNNKLKSVHKQLILNYTCENCDCIKSSYLFNAQYCSMVCYMQARDDPYTIEL